MTKFDTIKLEVPVESVRGTNSDAFIQTIRTDKATGQVEIFEQAKSHCMPPGLSSVKYRDGGEYQITLSAKTLGCNYLEGISLNNWQQPFNAIKGLIDIDTNMLWDMNPKILSCDTTDNISISDIGTHQQICEAMLAARTNKRFMPISYNTRKNIAFEFRGTQLEKNRIIGYAKHLDLLKPANKQFLKSLPNAEAMYKQAEKQIRFETNHTTFKAMRNRFAVDKNNLQEMLQSNISVNHNFLLKVIKGGFEQGILFEELEGWNDKKQFVMMKGIEAIIKQLNYDENSIIAFFKKVYEENFKYNYYKGKFPIKKMIEQLRLDSENSKAEASPIVKKCLSALLLSVA